MEIGITKISSRGQIVIPFDLRKSFSKGEELLIIKKNNKFILQPFKDIDKKFKQDLVFALKTEKMLKKYEKGEFKQKSAKEFLKELEKW